MKRIIETTVVLIVLVTFVSSAEAIKITLAEVQGGLAVVEGKKAARDSSITWEDEVVTAANHGGNFQFSGVVVPSDCVGTLSDGVDTIEVVLANCGPGPEPASVVLKTGQTTCWHTNGMASPCPDSGQDGEFQATLRDTHILRERRTY